MVEGTAADGVVVGEPDGLLPRFIPDDLGRLPPDVLLLEEDRLNPPLLGGAGDTFLVIVGEAINA